ncbi:MAG TPA: isoprenyl transferase [Pyrinomonadaceae bacterium]|nr:isoprenyl transferase [Pyrinomonadaceae bacterium]
MLKNFSQVIEPGSNDERLLRQIDLSRLPRHVAVIMDGNGRWARLRGKPRIFGHNAGAESVKSILDTCARLGIEAVTLYAFSTENWKRPKAEVSALMSMLKRYIRSEIDEVKANNIRFQAIGAIDGLSDSVRKEIAWAMEQTAANTGTVLSVALNYGGRAEIVEACRRAARQRLEQGDTVESIADDDIERNLYTHGLPDVDLLIRTSGEMRISNFLLWQLAYSEIYVTPTLFPDFRRQHVFEAIIEYQKRDRRFGNISSTKAA